MAQKTEEPDKKGIIPVSHVRLVYISDDGMYVRQLIRVVLLACNMADIVWTTLTSFMKLILIFL